MGFNSGFKGLNESDHFSVSQVHVLNHPYTTRLSIYSRLHVSALRNLCVRHPTWWLMTFYAALK